MMQFQRFWLTFLLLLTASQCTQADISVIVNPKNDFDLQILEVRKIFLQKTKTFPNGVEAIPLDLPDDHPSKALFSKLVLHKNQASLNAYWSRMLFSSKGQPPRKMTSDEVKAFVASNKQAIAYLDSEHVDKSVRVILTVP